MIVKKMALLLTVLVFVGCGEVTTGSGTDIVSSSDSEETGTVANITQAETVTVNLSGTVTYDSVPFKSASSAALDYTNITKKAVRGAVVDIVDASGTILKTTNTDANGVYSVTVTGTNVKVRVSAKLYKAVSSGASSWDFQVKDNTNSDALYVMEGDLAGLGTNSSQTRNLNASSGWDGSSYATTRVAAPFSILDVVYQSYQKVLVADTDLVFPPLDIFWSKNNRSGTIVTSHYNDSEVALYILGQENVDTDEYDTAILAHEWGHYYEHQFSRSDSIGGTHGSSDTLDIRLAFGEGFATAFSGLVMETPLYLDSGNTKQQGSLFVENLEEGGSGSNAGWFSEASIYHMLYDVYDESDDVGDSLSLSFSSLHNLLVDTQKNTPAFTSIFTYMVGLKDQNPTKLTEINALTSNEAIAPITDIYGTGRTNRTVNATPLYHTLSVGGSLSIVPNYTAKSTDSSRALGVYNFVKFEITTAGEYTINVSSTSGVNLDFEAYKEGESSMAITSSTTGTSISGTATLEEGTYRMHINDSNRVSGKTFTVTLN